MFQNMGGVTFLKSLLFDPSLLVRSHVLLCLSLLLKCKGLKLVNEVESLVKQNLRSIISEVTSILCNEASTYNQSPKVSSDLMKNLTEQDEGADFFFSNSELFVIVKCCICSFRFLLFQNESVVQRVIEEKLEEMNKENTTSVSASGVEKPQKSLLSMLLVIIERLDELLVKASIELNAFGFKLRNDVFPSVAGSGSSTELDSDVSESLQPFSSKEISSEMRLRYLLLCEECEYRATQIYAAEIFVSLCFNGKPRLFCALFASPLFRETLQEIFMWDCCINRRRHLTASVQCQRKAIDGKEKEEENKNEDMFTVDDGNTIDFIKQLLFLMKKMLLAESSIKFEEDPDDNENDEESGKNSFEEEKEMKDNKSKETSECSTENFVVEKEKKEKEEKKAQVDSEDIKIIKQSEEKKSILPKFVLSKKNLLLCFKEFLEEEDILQFVIQFIHHSNERIAELANEVMLLLLDFEG
eukprot:MONOS_4904.1-p1 / transcript=MONOS_4904.1 / gene=MONOS_4904 / organism=Monocercomonoides_exilis_PA203 / gene_product=unspecified product / transcript_product=unspecified product / location=Mono_scaffold00137:39700-41109(-) / protein_length=470 / sequence_SO=supercontig / SO=protein_coding / is_pseudo=false